MLKHALRREFGVSPAASVSFLAGTPSAEGRYTFKLLPPTEDEQDVVSALDALLRAEKAKQRAKHSSFASVKQHLLDTESTEMREAVAAS